MGRRAEEGGTGWLAGLGLRRGDLEEGGVNGTGREAAGVPMVLIEV